MGIYQNYTEHEVFSKDTRLIVPIDTPDNSDIKYDELNNLFIKK